MRKRIIPLTLGVLIVVTAGGADDADATTDPARATECADLIREVQPDLIGNDDEKAAHACRMEGYDPLWEAIGIYGTDTDYERWRDTGEVPTCTDIFGRENPLGGEYDERDVADCQAMASGEDPPEREGEFDTSISDAAAECGLDAAVGDEGNSITLDTEGDEDVTGDSIDDVACLLNELDIPESVVSRMEMTRALDGVQTAPWDDYTATWSYHPDSGMTLIVEEAR